uniref:DNA mismatch repair proteins mutS family domain-containing protein n=1 Tax=uncultured organism TaxID=155900 RepID=A0A3G1QTF3_9ZZZZ|nr:hypothetical protein [uncultured organism]
MVWLVWAKQPFSSYWVLAPVAIYALLAIVHERILRSRTRAEAAASFYRRGIARIEDRWTGTGESGDRFRDTKHVYADDLDIFGRGCLFELISTARLPMGENRLAEWLRQPSSPAEIRERHGSVTDLREKTRMREDIAVLGNDLRVRLDPESLIGWAESGAILPRYGVRLATVALSLWIIGALLYWVNTSNFLPLLIAIILVAIVNIVFRRRIKTILGDFSANADGILLFAQVLATIEEETFTDPRLQRLSAELKREGALASTAVRTLARLVFWIDARGTLIAAILEWLVLYSLQLAAAAEAWRRKHGRRMRACVEITAEMEALLSIAAYSHEHPGDPFPEIVDTSERQAIFEGQELGHPLIPAARCVRNSVTLDAATRVLLVSGSNMSGKSTLLRTVGINAVLAFAGAPIRAKALRVTPLALGTRIRTSDSLQEGLSNFYAEILRIRKVFELIDGQQPVLFLFDELLEGTNSHDRRIGAECLVRALIDEGAIGMVTTHDLALTEMAASIGSVVRNAHFQDYIENGEMRFDFKLREGVVTKSNALELMRLVGLKV